MSSVDLMGINLKLKKGFGKYCRGECDVQNRDPGLYVKRASVELAL
jgi:hypothetical protein